ncbi:MAG: glycosyltransferase [Caulobacteraceae bacterium]
MRLLILTPEFGEARGGLAAFYRHLVPPLAGLGVEIHVIEGSAAHAGRAAPRVIDGAQVETLELDRLTRWNDRFAALAAAPGLRRHLAAAWAMWEQGGEGAWADVVEAADWGLAYVPPAVAATRPLVVQGHGSIGQISVHDPLSGEEVQSALCRLIEVAVLARVPVLQTYSHLNADFWAAETGRPVTMIRPAVPMPALTAPAEISDRGLVAGRIQRWKGPDVLCEALALMGARAPTVDWLGRDTAYGRRDASTAAVMARAYPDIWGRRVLPAPSVAPAEVTARQAVARFNLVPSAWDVFNFTAVEAMASGRPAVVSTGAGASELVTDGETGFVFENGNAASLASALDRVIGSSEARLAAIGAAARETVRRELDPMRIAEARLAAYQAVIADFAQTPPAPIGGWLGDICRPDAATADAGAFLDQFPIRTVASHLASRLGEKLGARRS